MPPSYTQSFSTNERGGYLWLPRLSEEIRMSADTNYVWRPFADPDPAFGANQGDTRYYLKFGSVAHEGGVIAENETVGDTYITFLRDSTTIKEYSSKSINYTYKLETLQELNVKDPIIAALERDMVSTLDKAVALQARGCDMVYTPTGSTSDLGYALVTNGTPVATATRPCFTYDIKNIIDLMTSTYKMPWREGNKMVCVATSKFLRYIKDDPEFIYTASRVDANKLHYSKEVGEFYNCTFVQDNHVLENTITGGGGEAVFLAADAIRELVAVPERIEAKQGSDFGRDQGIRWAAMLGFDRTWDFSTDKEDRIIRVYSA